MQESVCKMPWSLVVADVLGIIKLLPCLCVLAPLRPGAFSAILTTWRNNRISLPPRVPISHRRALSPPLHSTKPLGPGMEDPIPTSNTSFSSLQFSNIFFCQFLIFFSSQPSECCQFKHRAQLYKSFSFPLCPTGIHVLLTPPLFPSRFR